MGTLTTVILSSAVVSGLVSIGLGYIFDSKKYIRDKKLSIYSDFLDQYEKLIPAEDITVNIKTSTQEESLAKARLALYQLEKYLWKIELITNNKEVASQAQKIYKLAEAFINATEVIRDAKDDHTRKEASDNYNKVCGKLNSTRARLIKNMNQDITSW